MRKVRENNVNFLLIKKKAEERRYQEEQLKLRLEEEKQKEFFEAENKKLLLLEQEKEKQRLIQEKKSLNFLYLGTYVHGERKVEFKVNSQNESIFRLEGKVFCPVLVRKCALLDSSEMVCQEAVCCEVIVQNVREEEVREESVNVDCGGFFDDIDGFQDSVLLGQGDDCLFQRDLKIVHPVRLLNREMGYFNFAGYLPGGSGLQQKSESKNKSKQKQIRRKKYKDSLFFLDLSSYIHGPGLSVEDGSDVLDKEKQIISPQQGLNVNNGKSKRRKRKGGCRRKGFEGSKEGDQIVSMSEDYKRLGWLRSSRKEDYNHITIRHFDCSLEVFGSRDYIRNVYGINPGLKELFPSLFNMAKRYDAYLFKNMFFELQVLNTQEDGIVGMAYLDYDDKRPVDAVDDMEAIYGFIKGNYVKQISYQVGRYYLDIDVWSKLFRRYVRIKSLEGVDDRDLYDTGRLFLSTEGFVNNDVVAKLKIVYDVEFFGLRVEGDESPRYDCEVELFRDIDNGSLSYGGEDKSVMNRCVVCFINQKDVLFLPCKHIVVCSVCFTGLSDCPVCRSQIINRVTGVFIT